MSALASERADELVEALHHAWHAAPMSCSPMCPYRERAAGAVRVLGPIIAGWLVEALQQAAAEITQTLGDPVAVDPTLAGESL